MAREAMAFQDAMTVGYDGPRIYCEPASVGNLEPAVRTFDLGGDLGTAAYVSTFADGCIVQFRDGTEGKLSDVLPTDPDKLTDAGKNSYVENFKAVGLFADKAKELLDKLDPETQAADRQAVCDAVLSRWQALSIRRDGFGRTGMEDYGDASGYEPTRAFENMQARVSSMQGDLMTLVSYGCKAGAERYGGVSDGTAKDDFMALCKDRAYAFTAAYESGFEGFSENEKAAADAFAKRVREACDTRATYFNLPQEDVPGLKFEDFGLSYHGVGVITMPGNTLDPEMPGVKALESTMPSAVCRFELESEPAPEKARYRDMRDLDAACSDIEAASTSRESEIAPY